MHKIDAPNATGANEFSDGDPAQGVLATVLWSKWLNTIQRELVAICAAAGIPLDAANDAQVLAAIQALIAAKAGVFVAAENGAPLMSPTRLQFNSSTLPMNEWRGIGPSGSGASHVWSALDLVPSGSKWIEVQIVVSLYGYGGEPGSAIMFSAAARRAGAATPLDQTGILNHSVGYAAPNAYAIGSMSYTRKIPVDQNRRFEIWWSVNGTTSMTSMSFTLLGYGFNNV